MMLHADDMYRLANDQIRERQRGAASELRLRLDRRDGRESLARRLANAAITALLA